jgi:hypothetical protein
VPDPAPCQAVHAVGEHVERLFHHQAPDEADHRHVVLDTEPAAPFHVAPLRVEDFPVDPARPDADVVVHPLIAEQLSHGIGWGEDRVAAPVESPERGDHDRLKEAKAVITKVGLETSVNGGHDRQVQLVRESHRPMAEHLRAGDVKDVGLEALNVPLHPWRYHQRRAILAPAGDRESRDRDQVPVRGESRLRHGRRIDPHRRATLEQIGDKPVQRLVGPVADVIVVAREDRDAKVVHVHRVSVIHFGSKGQLASVPVAGFVSPARKPTQPGDAAEDRQHQHCQKQEGEKLVHGPIPNERPAGSGPAGRGVCLID